MKLEYRPVWSQTTSRRKCTDIYNFSVTLATFETCFNNMNDKNTCYWPTGTYLETINTSNRQTQPQRAVLFPFFNKIECAWRHKIHKTLQAPPSPTTPAPWLRGNSSWGGVNYNQISFQWWSEKKLEFGCEGKKTNNSCNLCLKSSRGECKFIILQGKFSLKESGGGVVLVIFAQSGARH